MSARRKKPEAPPKPAYPKVEEVFGEPYLGSFGHSKAPSCFNGIVNVHRYRVTVELIDEPIDVLRERVRKLWRESNNIHHSFPLRQAASALGIELDSSERGLERAK